VATSNISTPDVAWVASAASAGNVLSNDLAGTNGGLHVTEVVGTMGVLVSATLGADVAGAFGTLHIASNGAYSYTPASGDIQPGAVDHFTYTVADANGHTSSADLVVTLANYTYASSATLIAGNDGDNTLLGTGSNEVIYGGWGNDSLTGAGGNDRLMGGAGNDTLVAGSTGSNVLIGGAGDDTMTGSPVGVDVFKWSLGDQGTLSAPAIDHITNFNTASIPNGGDVLDLKDLLVGEHSGGALGTVASNLDQYLSFEVVGGKLALDVHDVAHPANITQKIVLDNVAGGDVGAAKDVLGHALGMAGNGISDADLLKKLVDTGHLKTDI
jgi:Ca2+-binding RTX toxin-like protein